MLSRVTIMMEGRRSKLSDGRKLEEHNMMMIVPELGIVIMEVLIIQA